MNGSGDRGKRAVRPSLGQGDPQFAPRLAPYNHPTVRELSPSPVPVRSPRVADTYGLKVEWDDGRNLSPRASPMREAEPTVNSVKTTPQSVPPTVAGGLDSEEVPVLAACSAPGQCQAGGELRLSKLQNQGQYIDIPEGFSLVGMRSPQLGSLMVLAVVDKRYLPDDQTGFSLQGFSGNCVGCGRQGFRYFTEFCHHCNMKLTTQPKKQKHIRFYVIRSPAGVLTRGDPILWRAESRRRTSNTPAANVAKLSSVMHQQDRSPYSLTANDNNDHPDEDFDISPTEEVETEVPDELESSRSACPPSKKVKSEEVEPEVVLPGITPVVNIPPPMTSHPPPPAAGALAIRSLHPSQRSRSSEHIRKSSITPEDTVPKRASLAGPLGDLHRIAEEMSQRGLLVPQGDSSRLLDTERPVRARAGSFAGPSGVVFPNLSSKQQTPQLQSLKIPISTTAFGVREGTILQLQRKFPANPVLLSCQESDFSLPASVGSHVIVSKLLSGCFNPPKKDHSDSSDVEALSVSLPSEALALLVVNYFASLPESDLIRREYVDAMIHSARHGEASWAKQNLKQQHSMLLTHTQLPFLARLTAYASQGRVLVITAASIGEGVEAALTKLDSVHHLPDFVIILQASKYWSIEVGVLVVNPVQARGLAESNAQDAGVDPETVNSGPSRERQFVHLIAYGVGSPPPMNPPMSGIDFYLGDFARGLASNPNGDAFSPFGEGQLELVQEEDVQTMLGRIEKRRSHTESAIPLYPAQEAIAGDVMNRIRSISESSPHHLDLSRFQRVDLVVMIPPDFRLYHQTVDRLLQSGILDELGLLRDDDPNKFEAAAKHVIRGQYSPEESAKFVRFVARVRGQPTTLFLVVHDVAHLGLGKFEGEAANNVVVDTRLNCKDLLEAENVVALLVTSVPYALQHCCSRVAKENEIYWNDDSATLDGASQRSRDDNKFTYCGLSECAAVVGWTRQPQYVRQDMEFEDAVVRQCSDVNCHDLSESEIRAALLVRSYVSGMLGTVSTASVPIEQASGNATMTVLNDLIRCADGHLQGGGIAVGIRQPHLRLARFLQKKLTNARDMLGLKFRFEIILDDGTGDLAIGQHYLERLRRWRFDFDSASERDQALNWNPKSYADLEGLPCILIIAGESRLGNTLPRSLKYFDMRCTNLAGCTRAEMEQELGVGHCYINCPLATSVSVGKNDGHGSVSRRYPVVYFIPRSIYYLLHTPVNYVHDKRLLLRPDSQTEWVNHGDRRPLSSGDPQFVSSYYRSWTQPTKRHYDYGRALTSTTSEEMPFVVQRQLNRGKDIKDGFHPRRLLLSGPPQVGKTGAYLHVARLLNATLRAFQEVEVYDESELYLVTRQHPSLTVSDFPTPRTLCSVPCDLSTKSVVGNIAVSPVEWNRDLHLTEIEGMDSGEEYEQRRRDSEAAGVLVSLARGSLTGSAEVSGETSSPPAGDSHSVSDGSQETIGAVSRRGSGGHEGVSRVRFSDFGRVSRKTALVTVSLPCTYDAFHRSEATRQYREGVSQPSSMSRRGSRAASLGESRSLHPLQYTLVDGNDVVNLYWHIPSYYEGFFCINDGRQTISSLKLPVMSHTGVLHEDGPARAVKTPVFIPSTGRYEQGLLNLFYALNQSSHIAVIVVKLSELNFYACAWPNHVIMALPQSAEHLGLGAARHWIKKFATQNFQVECDRHNCRSTKGTTAHPFVWPFILMLDDSIVMWRRLTGQRESHVSLYDVLSHVEQDPGLFSYGLIGFKQWHCHLKQVSRETNFANCQVSHGAVLINLQKTLGFDYDRYCYGYSDLHFNINAGLNGLVLCRFGQFYFLRKHIPVGGVSNFQLPMKGTRNSGDDSMNVVDIHRLVCAPDSSNILPVQAPAYFLLETYMALAGPDLFPDAVGDTHHPVLVPGRFVNLGPKVTVYCVPVPIDQVTDTVFSGLLLYFPDSRLTSSRLRDFKFTPGARLCLVNRDRTTLRQEVSRLEIEDSWRLRLCDEFQTANSSGPPLFFLTGVYCP